MYISIKSHFKDLSKNSDLTGKLLVASPALDAEDYCFSRSVIYILKSSDEGALGVIINNRIDPALDPVIVSTSSEGSKHLKFKNLYFGGPVDDQLANVLYIDQYNGVDNTDVVKLGMNNRIMKRIESNKGVPRNSLFIIGHCSWGGGELEEEIKNGDWFVMPYNRSLVFGNKKDKWEACMDKLKINPDLYVDCEGSC